MIFLRTGRLVRSIVIHPYDAVRKIYRILLRRRINRLKRSAHHRILVTQPVNASGGEPFDLHILACEKDLEMSLWALKTFYYFSETNPLLVLHDDGSLSSGSKEIYQTHFRGCRILERDEADSRIDKALENYPLSRKMRQDKRFYCSLKLFDSFHFCEADHVLQMDSDILFFQKPEELLKHIANRQPCFLSDYQDAYSFDWHILNDVFSTRIEHRGNAGLFFMSRQAHFEHLDLIERYFREMERLGFDGPPNRHEQTLNVMILSHLNAARLSSTYQISSQPVTPNTVMHHYVSDGSRKRMYLEGVRKLGRTHFPPKTAAVPFRNVWRTFE